MNSHSPTPARPGSIKSLVFIVLLVLGATQGMAWWRDQQAASRIKAHLGTQHIMLYTTVTCVYCAKAKAWLKQHEIAWDECDVEVDAGCKATFEAQGAPGTPLVRIGQTWQLGFDPQQVASALEASATSPRP